MKLGVSITNYSFPNGPADLARIARDLDAAGLDTLWVPDHVLQADPFAPEDDTEMFEAYTTLGYLAALTSRIRLGTMVTGATFRPPAILVKAVTTLDVLSGGRAWLGIGAGYLESEATAMAIPLPPTAERFERLEEILRIALHLWRDDGTPFEGTHYRLEHPVSSPPPVRRPHPPILVGGTGERKTLRLVAQYGDACNLPDIPDGGATVERKLQVLARHCETYGRSYDSIEKTLSTRLEAGESVDAFVRRSERAADWGIDHIVVLSAAPVDDAMVAVLAEVNRRLAD